MLAEIFMCRPETIRRIQAQEERAAAVPVTPSVEAGTPSYRDSRNADAVTAAGP